MCEFKAGCPYTRIPPTTRTTSAQTTAAASVHVASLATRAGAMVMRLTARPRRAAYFFFAT